MKYGNRTQGRKSVRGMSGKVGRKCTRRRGIVSSISNSCTRASACDRGQGASTFTTTEHTRRTQWQRTHTTQVHVRSIHTRAQTQCHAIRQSAYTHTNHDTRKHTRTHQHNTHAHTQTSCARFASAAVSALLASRAVVASDNRCVQSPVLSVSFSSLLFSLSWSWKTKRRAQKEKNK